MPKWQLIERKIVALVIRLSHFDNRGLLLRYCLLRHFELEKALNPKLVTTKDHVDQFSIAIQQGGAIYETS